MLLTAPQLASIRATTALLFTDSLILRRFDEATDAYGNPTRGVPVDTVINGRLINRSSNEVTTDRDTQVSEWAVLLPYDTDVRGGDQIVSGTRVFEVIGPPVFMPNPTEATHLRAALRHVTGA